MTNDPLDISGMHDGAKRASFENARKLRSTMTEPEKILWEFLKMKPLGFKFRRQHPIGRFILDFYCHSKRLSIEIDGCYHLKSDQKEKDIERTAYLKTVGITEIRFKNEFVLDYLEDAQSKIESVLSGDSI